MSALFESNIAYLDVRDMIIKFENGPKVDTYFDITFIELAASLLSSGTDAVWMRWSSNSIRDLFTDTMPPDINKPGIWSSGFLLGCWVA